MIEVENIYFVKIGKINWVKSYERGQLSLLLPRRVPKTLEVTNEFDKAMMFRIRQEADEVAWQFNGKVVAPKGGLVPVEPVKTDE